MSVRAPTGRVVLVEEVVFASEDGDFRYGSGRFSATLLDGEICEEGPQAVSMEAAMEWARARGAVIVMNGRPEA